MKQPTMRWIDWWKLKSGIEIIHYAWFNLLFWSLLATRMLLGWVLGLFICYTKRTRDVIGLAAIEMETASNVNKLTIVFKKINFKFSAKNSESSCKFQICHQELRTLVAAPMTSLLQSPNNRWLWNKKLLLLSSFWQIAHLSMKQSAKRWIDWWKLESGIEIMH